MSFRTFEFLLFILLASFTSEIVAWDPSVAELREYFNNTTEYKCWNEACTSLNQVNHFVVNECRKLFKVMLNMLEKDDFLNDHNDKIHSVMFKNQGTHGEKTSTIPFVEANNSTESHGKRIVFTADMPGLDSCINPKYLGNPQNQNGKTESNELANYWYWAIPVLFFVLLVNFVGGIYFYFRFGKIEAYHRYMERQTEMTMPLEMIGNVGSIM